MSLNILKTLGIFLMVYSPLLIAFAATFYILLPSQPSFTNFPMALIKTLAMMTGEFELDDYFQWDLTKNDFGHVSSQLIFVGFLIFVNIVISNLLIGLTVNKTDKVFKNSGTLRLEKTVHQLVEIDALLQSKSR